MMNRTLAWIIRELITTVPMVVGLFTMIGTVGAYELDNINFTQALTQLVAGFASFGIGTAILNYFHN